MRLKMIVLASLEDRWAGYHLLWDLAAARVASLSRGNGISAQSRCAKYENMVYPKLVQPHENAIISKYRGASVRHSVNLSPPHTSIITPLSSFLRYDFRFNCTRLDCLRVAAR